MVKINYNAKNKLKSKLNMIKNCTVTRNKKDKMNNKKLKKLSNHVKLNVINYGDTDLNVGSSSMDVPKFGNDQQSDGNFNKSGTAVHNKNNKSFSKLFRQSKAQREKKHKAKESNYKIPENTANKLTSNIPVKSPSSLKTKPSENNPGKFVSKADCTMPVTSPKMPTNTIKSIKTNVLIDKPLTSTKVIQLNDKPERFSSKNSEKKIDTNGISQTQTNPLIIPKTKRKTYENGWLVEELVETEIPIKNESSDDSDRDSYIDKFFDNDTDVEQPKPNIKAKYFTRKRSKTPKCMLLINQSSQLSENSDDSSESSHPNFVKLKRKPKQLSEQSSSEVVPFVAAENGDTTTDSEYDPSWNPSSDDQYEGMDVDEIVPYIAAENDDLTTDSEYGSSWSPSSYELDDEPYIHNEYIEYSAEEVESASDESGTEESTDSEFSDENESYGVCFSDEDTYNSEDDEDYIPDVNDDLYICRGDAKIYDVQDNNISFNSDEGAQIFEINDTEQTNASDMDSCPDLVPITLSRNVSAKSPAVNFNYSVVEEILKDSEDEELISEDDDDFLSNISAYQTVVNAAIQDNADHTTDEENNQGKSRFYNSPVSPQLVLLHLKEILYFHGNFKATLIHGSAKSFGYEFVQNKPIEFYSPSCDSLLYLKPVESGKSSKFNSKFLEEYFSNDIIKEIILELAHSSGDAILLLDYHESKRVECIRQYMRDEIFPVIDEQVSRPFQLSEIRLKTNFIFSDSRNYSGYRKLETEAAWDKISIQRNSRLMVIGGKNVGKSSLIRYLINSNINRIRKILLIDFDIGQPEIYIPQTISATVIDFPVLGPGCLHKVKPKKVLLFGDISITSEQIKYIHACNMLIQYCTSNEELSAMPWIINTMGYNKGLGDEIIAAYIKTIKPTDVVQINSSRTADNFNQLFTPEYTNQFQFNMFTKEFQDIMEECNHNLIVIEAFSKMYDRNMKGLLSAKDKRLMMILAHLGDILDVNDTKWLTDAEVKKINLNDLHIFTSYNLDKFGCTISLLKAVLDMTFVYLCNKNNDMSTDTTADCIGFGLVRHVDKEMKILYLVTAVSDDDLELVNALALTNVTIAKAILEKQCILVDGCIKSIGLSDNFIGTRQVQPQTYRPDTTVNTRSNFVKE